MALTQVPSVMIDRPLVTIASASTVAIGASASENISVTGTTTITAFDTVAAGAVRSVTFAGILTLTHNATSLILPGSANITTAAGDVGTFISLGTGNWRCVNYTKASGLGLVSTYSGNNSQLFTASGTFTVPVGVSRVHVIVIGGGGGASAYWGISGLQGGFAIGDYDVTAGSSVSVTVGAGSAAISTSGLVPTAGTSSFGAYCSATGATGVGNGNGANGAVGAGTSGTLSNSKAVQKAYTAIGAFCGLNVNANTIAAAIAYAPNSGTVPGAGGVGTSGCVNTGFGGTGGAVFVEW